MADKEVKSVGFSLTKSMIKLVQDVDSGIIPLEGEKQEDGVEWVKNKGQNFSVLQDKQNKKHIHSKNSKLGHYVLF